MSAFRVGRRGFRPPDLVAAIGSVSAGCSVRTGDIDRGHHKGALRGHREGDFEAAYAYFAASTAPERGTWISGEEDSGITGSTVNSLEVDEVSAETATATVDVSFEDKTGTPRFLITWSL